MGDSATAARKQLGRAIRVARSSAGLTQADLAERCGWSRGLQPKIGKLETGRQSCTIADAQVLASSLKVDESEAEEWVHLASQTREASEEHPDVPPHFQEYLRAEPRASEVLSWHVERIPGILQAEPYMLAMFERHRHSEKIYGRLRARRNRQQVLALGRPTFKIILSESALWRMPSEHQWLVLEQLRHLITVAYLYEHVHLHLMPFTVPMLDIPQDFTILRGVVATEPGVRKRWGRTKHDPNGDFVYFEDGRYHHASEAVSKREHDWRDLHSQALSRHDTVAFLDQMIERRRAAP
ncbi:Scr1 family TA system antitoxin-like transcriptional regulator [Saccharopolyspora gloriosae]|uniref:Scr1 family TA system antitoxin-like transcriptional regulator n=1 Tax=Saccharopolyspora gloriosae TaxID=455344 RepID=UPI001FB797D6|nr:Scr1 family TA system antitoxin-like transcriptional regulator [Saccharopolyspora gloriosae]